MAFAHLPAESLAELEGMAIANGASKSPPTQFSRKRKAGRLDSDLLNGPDGMFHFVVNNSQSSPHNYTQNTKRFRRFHDLIPDTGRSRNGENFHIRDVIETVRMRATVDMPTISTVRTMLLLITPPIQMPMTDSNGVRLIQDMMDTGGAGLNSIKISGALPCRLRMVEIGVDTRHGQFYGARMDGLTVTEVTIADGRDGRVPGQSCLAALRRRRWQSPKSYGSGVTQCHKVIAK